MRITRSVRGIETNDVGEAPEVAPPPPPPPPVAPPRGSDDAAFDDSTPAPAQTKPLELADGFSGRLQVELDGRQTEVTAVSGMLYLEGREVGRVAQQSNGQLQVLVNGQTSVAQPMTAGATSTAAQQETWPNGPPSSYVKTRFPPTPETQPDRQLMIDTVLAVLPAEQREPTRAFIETGGAFGATSATEGESKPGGVSDESLRKAFDAVLAARNSPGQKTLELSLVPTRIDTRQVNDESSSRIEVTRAEGEPKKLSLSLDVDARGRVNGAPLVADQLTRLGTETERVPVEEKQLALEEAGVPREWLGWASEEQKTQALARIREAALTPGEKTIDLSFDRTETVGGGDGDSRVETRRVEGKFTLKVDDQGNVGGKPLRIDVAVATTNQFDQLSVADKKAMLQQVGLPKEDVDVIAPDRMTAILTRVAMMTREPGEHSIEVDTGPEKFRIAAKVAANGDLEGIGAEKLPKPKKQKWYQKALGPILTIASFVFPAAAPFIRIAQAGLAIANGARGLNLVGAVVGAAAGLSSAGIITGSAATFVNTANQVVGTARAVQGAVQGFRNGDVLGGLSSAISAGTQAAGLLGDQGVDVTQARNFLLRAGDAVGIANQVNGTIRAFRSGDVLGGLGGALDLANGQGLLGENGGTIRTAVGLAGAIRNRDFEGAFDGLNSLSLGLTGRDVLGRPPRNAAGDADAGGDDDSTTPATTTGATTTTVAEEDPWNSEPPPEPSEIFGPPAPPEEVAPPQGTITVGSGQSLTSLAAKYLGDASKWPLLYLYNQDLIGADPNKLQAGATLNLPPEGFDPSRADQNDAIRTAARRETPPSPSDDDYLGSGIIGYAEGEDGPEPVKSTMTPAERAAEVEKVKASLDPDRLKKNGFELVKTLGDLNTIIGNPQVAADVLEGLKRGDFSALGKLMADETTAAKLIEAAGKVDPKSAARFGALSTLATFGTGAIAGYEALADSASTSAGGKTANVIGAMAVEVLLGKASPQLDILDAVTNAAGRAFGSKLIENSGVKKNLAAGLQNLFVFAEAIGAPPGKREELITRLADKILAEDGPVIVRGYYRIGEVIANTAPVDWAIDRLAEASARRSLADQAAQNRARLQERVRRIQTNG